MRAIAEIEKDLNEAEQRCATLKKELCDAQLQLFFKENGVPKGALPIFVNRKGERVLVNGFDGHWALGVLVKKDGGLSATKRRLFDSDKYQFEGNVL